MEGNKENDGDEDDHDDDGDGDDGDDDDDDDADDDDGHDDDGDEDDGKEAGRDTPNGFSSTKSRALLPTQLYCSYICITKHVKTNPRALPLHGKVRFNPEPLSSNPKPYRP